METFGMQVDGESLTALFRNLFWEDGRPYSFVKQFILDSLGLTEHFTQQECEEIVKDILEGRKKLVGVNNLVLSDDSSEPVRHLTDKLEQVEWEKGILLITKQMNENALPFVDPYSTAKSIKALKEGITGYGSGPFTREQCERYFGMAQPEAKPADITDDILPACKAPLYAGLWLLDEPETAYEVLSDGVCKAGSQEFWERIYQKTKDREGFGYRNERYLTSLKREAHRRSYKPWETGIVLNASASHTAEIVDNKEDIPIAERTEPDDFIEWEGLIGPDGKFYSCGFGGHCVKAWHLIDANWIYWDKILTEQEKGRAKRIDEAEDILITHGWAATKSDFTYGDHIACPAHLTSYQTDTIEQANAKHNRQPVEIPAFGYR